MTRPFSAFAYCAAVVATFAAAGSPEALAQSTLAAGKSAAQVFETDCTSCHKSPRGLASAGPRGLAAYLAQHYMAGRETAAAMADYLSRPEIAQPEAVKPDRSGRKPRQNRKPGDAAEPAAEPVEKPASEPRRARPTRPAKKPVETSKPSNGVTPGESAPNPPSPPAAEQRAPAAEPKLPEPKPPEPKPPEPKPPEPKPPESKAPESRPPESSETKSPETRSPEATSPADAASGAPAAPAEKPAE